MIKSHNHKLTVNISYFFTLKFIFWSWKNLHRINILGKSAEIANFFKELTLIHLPLQVYTRVFFM